MYFWIGIYPIRDHYYDPKFNFTNLKKSLRADRDLPGIDFNDKEQLELLDKFNYNKELKAIPYSSYEKTRKNEFCYSNSVFASGDAEYLYNMVRHYKPSRIIEIGSGQSTLMAMNALEMNKKYNKDYKCKHICIEPFSNLWLEETNAEIIRDKVENIEVSFFNQLQKMIFCLLTLLI